ncbi:MAG: response regulator [Lachnospiraceae bacterium]|nr:response regulator [Lachnospiraceae bacterium]
MRKCSIKKIIVALLLLWVIRSGQPLKVFAGEDTDTKDYLAEYEATRYDEDDGLVSSEINAIAQTTDGYLWVGTYSGLYRYDGLEFDRVVLDERISNVMALFVDSAGRLWIGTNDSGIACYDPADGSIVFYTSSEGLSADTIRSISEDDKGNVYVGTVSGLSVISVDGTVSIPQEYEELAGIRSLDSDRDGVVAGVTNSGTLFIVRDGKVLYTKDYPQEGIDYTVVDYSDGGRILAGTTGTILQGMIFDGIACRTEYEADTGSTAYFNDIIFDAAHGVYFFAAENGLGVIDPKSREITDMMQYRFESSVSGVIKDYQGNIWFVSNKQGILEYSPNPFTNVFVKAGLDDAVVNSVALHDGRIYIGTDDGLRIINEKKMKAEENALTQELKGVRIRHIMEDSKGHLWISTYAQNGLIEAVNGNTVNYNELNGTLGGRFRYVLEMQDGVIAAASNVGLNYISEGKVIKTLGIEDGINAQILTMVQEADGTLIAGTDGDGVYVIKDGAIIKRIGKEEGLETLVVLRIVACDDGYLYVTSNAIYYGDKDSARRLRSFPYNNNYDIHISDDEAWTSSSAGIYIVKTDELIADKEYSYSLLDHTRGFNTTLTANAWNAVLPGAHRLLLCCTDGVRAVDTTDYDYLAKECYITVKKISCADEEIQPAADGSYTIPAVKGRIQIQSAVLNYTLSNPLVRMYLEGATDNGITVYQKDLVPLEYTNLPYGNYTLHVQMLDTLGNKVLRDEAFRIIKKPRILELVWVRVLILLLGALLVGFAVWRWMQSHIILRQYEQIRLAKEEAERANSAKSRFLANMSHEIRTPINTIMGMDEMILREDVSRDQKEYTSSVTGYARDIKRAAESLLSLINDILDLSKIESGKMNLVEQDYDTEEMLRAIVTMIRVRSNEKNLEFTVDADPLLPRKLHGDFGKIKQVLLNMLTNAVKYTEKGGFTLKLEVLEKDDKYCSIRYSVKDTGIGIKEEDMDKLFSAFERLDEKRNSGIQGTGLGLDISRQFVELMGDELKCDSVYGKGSTFYFTMKQAVVDAEAIGIFDESREEVKEGKYIPLFTAADAEVLVVDDNEMNLQVIRGLLKGTKVKITTAMSGRECLDKIRDKAYHIVLLDHMMPGMDGIETVHEIRKEHKDLPVIALTANAATSGEDYYISEGFNGFLAKPVDASLLEKTLAKYLPDELKHEATEEDIREETESEELGILENIEGISVKDGIKNCGSADAFCKTVKTFYDTLTEKADEIEKAYNDEDWKFYTIKVHALKSSARIIGAKELSGMAERMEDAGKNDRIDEIKQETEALLELYRSYAGKLSVLDQEETGDEKEEIPADMLEDAYGALTELIPMMDMDGVEMVVASVEEYRMKEKDEKFFKELRKKMQQADWDAMMKMMG